LSAHAAVAAVLLAAGYWAKLRPSYLALAMLMLLLNISATTSRRFRGW